MARNNPHLDTLVERLESYSQFSIERLVSRPEWGEIDLEDARFDIERIQDSISYLYSLPLEYLPMDAQKRISQEVEHINNLYSKIDQFSISSSNSPGSQRDQFVNEIQTRADAFLATASPWIPFLAYQKGDVSDNIEKMRTALDEANKLGSETKKALEKNQEEMNSIIEAAREASAAAGAAVFTKEFDAESRNITARGKKWLFATGAAAFVTILAAILCYLYLPDGEISSVKGIQIVTTKLIMLGVFVTGTLWCGRIYKALMHQAAANRQRALSIQTLQAFVAAVSDPAIKDAVVAEAARSVFGASDTGYVSGGNGRSESDVRLFEIARSITPSGD